MWMHSNKKLARHVLGSGKVTCCIYQSLNNTRWANNLVNTVKTNNIKKYCPNTLGLGKTFCFCGLRQGLWHTLACLTVTIISAGYPLPLQHPLAYTHSPDTKLRSVSAITKALELNMTNTFITVLCGRHHGWELPAYCKMCCSLQHYCLLVCDAMQSGREAPTFHKNFCFHQGRRSRQ